MNTPCSVYIVDSDASMRRHLMKIVKAQGYEPTPFANGSDFIEALVFLPPGICLIELSLCDMDGVNLLGEMREIRKDIVTIMTATGADIRTAVIAMKGGASDFLEKPFTSEFLMQALGNCARELDKKIKQFGRLQSAAKQISFLNKKELDIMISLSEERDNKKVAERFGVSVRTVESYRSSIMKKIGVKKFSDALLLLYSARFLRDLSS